MELKISPPFFNRPFTAAITIGIANGNRYFNQEGFFSFLSSVSFLSLEIPFIFSNSFSLASRPILSMILVMLSLSLVILLSITFNFLMIIVLPPKKFFTLVAKLGPFVSLSSSEIAVVLSTLGFVNCVTPLCTGEMFSFSLLRLIEEIDLSIPDILLRILPVDFSIAVVDFIDASTDLRTSLTESAAPIAALAAASTLLAVTDNVAETLSTLSETLSTFLERAFIS